MSKGLSISRHTKTGKNEIYFYYQDSNGETIQIKQTLTEVLKGQVRFEIAAPRNVAIYRGELLAE